MLGRQRNAGGFDLLKRIGSGGQAEVYLARPRRGAGRAGFAAIKIARPSHSAGLHDEHGWLAGPGGQHPGLPTLYARHQPSPGDLGYVTLASGAHVPFLALTYLPGQTLEKLLIQRGGRGLSPHLVIHIAQQSAVVLDHLHRQIGIVHHDVRPANLLIGPGHMPSVTLLDLGAAESLHTPRRHWIYGTPGYLPPESHHAGAAATPLTDIYSLGMTMRIALGQQRIPPALSTLIHAATQPNPQQRAARIPDMATLIKALRH